MSSGKHITTSSPGPARPALILGVMFTALAICALLSVEGARAASVQFTAVEILIWGLLGMGLSCVMRPAPEWSTALAGFGLLAATAAFCLVSAAFGVAALALLAVFGCLCESVFKILYGLRLQPGNPGGVWLIASGLAAAAIGFAMLWVWPETVGWRLDLYLGVNFLTTALALVTVAIAARRGGQ